MNRFVLVAASFFCLSLASGQILEQLSDAESDGAYPLDLMVAGDKLFFLSATKAQGEGLWVKDGTSPGAHRLPIPGTSGPLIRRVVDGNVYCNAADGSFWRTDGTDTGTVKIFEGNGQLEYNSAYALGKLGTRLIFCAYNKVYALDDRGGEPQMLADTPASNWAPAVVGADGRMYFAGGDAVFAFALWSTDGTPAGTTNLGGVPGGIWDLARAGSYIMVKGDILLSSHPYRADGTVNGIKEFTHPKTGEQLSHITFVRRPDRLIIVDQTPGRPSKLYATADGESLQLVTASGPDNYPPAIQSLGDAMYYNRYASNGTELWKTKGDAKDAILLSDAKPVPAFVRSGESSNEAATDVIQWGDYLYYFAATEDRGWAMWRMHVNGSSPEMVADLPDSLTAAPPRQLVVFQGALYFSAHDGVKGRKLWTSDGTAKGTRVAVDTFAGSYTAFPEGLKVLNDGRAYFLTRAQNGYNMTVWRSDGTRDGTVPIIGGFVSPPTPSGEWPSEGDKTEMFEHNGILYVTGNDGVHGHELWRTDGTEKGTFLLKDIYTAFGGTFDPHPTGFTVFKDAVYFATADSEHSWQIWKTDGTKAGTVRVSNFGGGTSRTIPGLKLVGQMLYFTSGDNEHGHELYQSDGTDAGTHLVKDIEPGPNSSNPRMLGELNGKLLFSAGGWNGTDAQTLWITDGTEEGTHQVNPDRAEQPTDIFAAQVYKNRLYFTAVHPLYGDELWVSDGTQAGTYLFKDIVEGKGDAHLSSFEVMDGVLYFYGDNGKGSRGLWKTYGTPEGTSFVARVPLESGPYAAGGLLYCACVRTDTRELWRSDGTAAGTFPLKLNPIGESYPYGFAALGEKMLFFGYDGFTGHELWSATPDHTRPAARLANISTRGYVGSGDGSLIGGFIVNGTGAQTVAVRAIGPALSASLSNALANPNLTLYDGNGAQLAANDDWGKGDAEVLTAAGLALADPLESGLVATLQPGSYTARVSGAGDTAGIGLVEVFNLNDRNASSKLANISTRGNVRGGDEILIGGFIIDGAKPRRLAIRALGRSLASNGVPLPGRLADAKLALFDSNGALLAENNDWRQAQAEEIEALQLAPGHDSDAALLIALPAGAYTAQVSGNNNASGVALVEVYALE